MKNQEEHHFSACVFSLSVYSFSLSPSFFYSLASAVDDLCVWLLREYHHRDDSSLD
jgi:hypothetical protein